MRSPARRGARPPALARLVVATLLVTAAFAWARVAQVPAHAAGAVRPPVITGDRPDPELVHDGTAWFSYGTNVFPFGVTVNVPVTRGTTLDSWTHVGDALPELGAWASPGLTWAPGVARLGDRWVLYYTAHHASSGRQCIGRAVAADPEGPFEDSFGAPLVCQLDRGGSIDPDPFVDADGRAWLVWKSDDNALGQPTVIWSQQLTADGASLIGAAAPLLVADAEWEKSIIENPSMVAIGGQLWLFYSGGWWDAAGYAVGYARCAAVSQACVKSTGTRPWLSLDAAGVPGVGGATVVAEPGRAPVMAFHGWVGGVGYGSGGVRAGFVEPLDFGSGSPDWRPDWGRDGSRGNWYLANEPLTGRADLRLSFGDPGDIPIAGDWDGDGRATVGVFRAGRWFLRNSSSSGFADATFGFGDPRDVPVVGRWVAGDDRYYPGVVRNGVWYLRTSHTTGVADLVISYGTPTDVPVVGDWNGDGVDTPGVFRSGRWYLRNWLSSGFADIEFTFGDPSDLPLTGRWAEGDASHLPGVLRNGAWFLRHQRSSGVADVVFGYGNPGDAPLIGDWNADRRDTVGVRR